jgi:uncharacterized protein
MVRLDFITLGFELKKDNLQVNLLNIFYTKIPINELNSIGPFKLIDKHTIEFKDTYEHKANTKFSYLLAKYFKELKNSVNGNEAVYVHRNSNIPLIGNVSFGIVYRDTSLIEIKPITSCNLNCIYCSVGEGKSSQKTDFVVEKDYLIEELEKLLEFVEDEVEVHIGVQGEPLLYADLIPLITDLHKNKQISLISMDSNFTLATKPFIDELAKFDKLRLNISLDALTPEVAEKMAGCKYNLDYVLKMIQYANEKGIKILIAPLYVPGYNDQELEKIVQFVKELNQVPDNKNPIIGIQNFLNYKTGRNPVKAVPWEDFYQMIAEIEDKKKIQLRLSPENFGIRKTKSLPKPFYKDDVISVIIKSKDRFKDTCLAVAKNRVISIPNCKFKEDKKVKVKLTRDKHNIFNGKLI